MSVRVLGGEHHADRSLCGWGNCQATTDGHPICGDHLRKAWAIVQTQLNAAQQHAAAHVRIDETAS